MAVEWRLCGVSHKRHTAAMRFLDAGIDAAVIALWLGHESTATTSIYLHADMAIKRKALDRTRQPGTPAGDYQPADPLLSWLQSL
jgi:integrase/recombinase XerD